MYLRSSAVVCTIARFNRTIIRYANLGQPIPADKVEQMVSRYYDRWLIHRSRTIARTEANRALNTGREATFQELIEAEGLRPEQVAREWITSADERVRHSHRFMNHQIRLEGQAFESGNNVPLMFPNDPSAPPEESINCRCSVLRNIDFVAADAA